MQGVRSGGLAMAVVLLVAACGSGDDAGGSSRETALVSSVPFQDEPDAADSELAADPEVAAFLASDEFAEADRLATVAVEAFGSSEAAADAVLFALDAGYAGEQIEAALLAGTLQPASVVEGVEPAFPPTNLLIGFRRSTPEPLPVERLRRAATEEAAQLGLVEPGGVSGRNGLRLLLVLVTSGIPPEAIVKALILGFEWPWELEPPLDFECLGEASSAGPIVVAGVVYPPLGCGEPYPLSRGDPQEGIELVGEFAYEGLGPGTEIVSNELRVTVTTDGFVTGEGTIVTRTFTEQYGCRYDYEWQGDFGIEGVLDDTLSAGGGTVVQLKLTSQQRHNFNRTELIDPDDDRDCVVQIVDSTNMTTGTGELVLSDPATITATIEPARPSPFVQMPSFEASEV